MMASLHRTKQLKRALTFLNKDERVLSAPIHKGYMYKEGTFHGSFNRRFFALYPRYLVYYESEHDYNRDVKHGNLENRHGAVRLDRVYLSKPDAKPKGGKYCFTIHAPDATNKRHEYLLVSKTRDERRQWMTKLQDQNPKLIPHDQHVAPDTPLPHRKIRSDSHISETDISKLSIKSQGSNPDSDIEEHELEIHEGDSDHEYHEPNEEEDVRQNGNGDSDCITVTIPVIPLSVK